MTPNQVIAHNLREARRLHGWTQERAAAELEPYLGTRWSVPVFSAAERSVAGERIREFSADDVHAFCRAFKLPLSFFFKPPPTADRIVHGHVPENGESPSDYFARVVGLDDPENLWLVKYLDDVQPPDRAHFQEALDKHAKRAAEDAVVHELYPLTEWAEQLQGMASQLRNVRRIAEAEPATARGSAHLDLTAGERDPELLAGGEEPEGEERSEP